MTKMTHEEYVAMQRAAIINTAKDIIAGTTDTTEAVRFLYNNWGEAGLPRDIEIYRSIMNIEDDLDCIPKGEEREKYNEEYLIKMDQEENEILKYFQKSLIEVCKNIVKQYS